MGFSVSSELYKIKIGGNKNLSENHLYFKVLILLKLTSASMPSSLHLTDIRFVVNSHFVYIFAFHK